MPSKRRCSGEGRRASAPKQARSSYWSSFGTLPGHFTRVIAALGEALELAAVEIHRSKSTRGVPFGLVVEVPRAGIATLATRRHRQSPHAVLPELDHRHEAVAARAVHPARPRIRPRTE